MITHSTSHKTYGAKGDKRLEELYHSHGSKTTQEKINTLKLKLSLPDSNYYAFGGEITDEMKLGCLEYEFLERAGEIPVELA